MKKYDLIIGFGCSFMEGGGLDNQTIHMRMHGLKTPISLNETEEFRYKNNFIAYLAELYNCEYINFAESRCPNDLIFENIYKYFNNNVSDKKILLVGQISLFNRIYAYYEPIEKFVKISALRWEDHPFNCEPQMKELYDYFERHLKYIYNEDAEYKKTLRNIETYTAWLTEKNIDSVWLSYEGRPDQFTESKNFIKFDGDNLGAYVEKNKLRLKDDPILKTDDLHMTINAHRLVANTIYEKIRG